MKNTVLGVAAIASAMTAGAMAQSISTTTPNNGSGGIFLHLTPSASPIQVNSFQTYFSSVTGTPVTVEVWTRPGAYAGFTASNVGWTLHQTVVGTSAGSTVLSGPVAINPLFIPTGGPTSVYFHAITAGGGIRYTGTAAIPPQVSWANADLTLFSDAARWRSPAPRTRRVRSRVRSTTRSSPRRPRWRCSVWAGW